MKQRSRRKGWLARLFFIAMLSCWVAMVALPATADADFTADTDFATIDRYVTTTMESARVPGLALAIVHGDTIVHSKGFGVAGPDQQPVTPQTAFILGSLSKSFTAMAIMQLAEAGKLDLDAPVQRYISWFALADAQAGSQITLRQLLYHTSGIPTNAPRASGTNPTLADQVRALRDTKLDHAPGAVHDYASPNYQILGLIVEQVSGQPFGEYIQQHIFSPLQMQHSFAAQAAQNAGMATGYQYWFGFPAASTLPYEPSRLPTAALIASAEDLGQYVIAQLNEGRYAGTAVLGPQAMAATHQPGAPSEGFSYAMGWRVGSINGIPAIHHGGIVANYRGKIVMVPEQKWGVIVLTNASSLIGSPTSHEIADGVATMLAGQTPPRSTLTLNTLYLGLTIGLGLITLNQLGGLFQLRRWRSRMVEQLRGEPSAKLRIGMPLALEALFLLALVIVLPRLIGIPFEQVMQQAPDISWWLIVTIGIGVVTLLIKTYFVRVTLRQANRAMLPQR